MNKYNPEIHKRRSVRLKDFDYGSEGLYFVTISTQAKEHFFGEIVNGEMSLNKIGEIVQLCWEDIPKHFDNVSLHSFVIMPNHIHGIIEIVTNVGAKNVLPKNENEEDCTKNPSSEPKGTSKTIGSIVRGFKIGVTKWVRQHTDIYQIWQRSYHEHIIRNENAYFRINEYIENNPKKWEEDCYF